jgi:hypothetical protein
MSKQLRDGVWIRYCDYCHNRPIQNLRGVDLCAEHLLLTLAELEEQVGVPLVKK